MQFEPHTIYHIYNQGNNRQTIFFREANYLFFLKKARRYMLPYCDILCYCLMPNHFHFLVYVREVYIDRVTPSHPVNIKANEKSLSISKPRSFSDSIAIMLRSYTRAINKQENRSGALFREGTKAKNGIIEGFITLHSKHDDLIFGGEMRYEATCFAYIHQNPVQARLVQKPEDWLFSSAPDYAGLRNGTLCNQHLAKKLGIV